MLVEQIHGNLTMFFLKVIDNLMRTFGDFLVRDRTSHRRNKEAEFFNGCFSVACYLFCAQCISRYISFDVMIRKNVQIST